MNHPKRHIRFRDDGSGDDRLPPPPKRPCPIRVPDKADYEIATLPQLLATSDKLRLDRTYRRLSLVLPVLRDLESMVGMAGLKAKVVDLVLFQIQGLRCDGDEGLHHVVVTGSPGTGKSRVVGVLARLYHALGMLSTDTVVHALADTLIGRYVGQTAPKTQAVLDDARGGVLVLDEAYSLGGGRESDSFAKECIDCINRFLTETPDFLMIVAGYSDALERMFFATNDGLARRFPYRFHVDDYSPAELREIFLRQVDRAGWSLEAPDALDVRDFSSKPSFTHNGGSCLNFFTRCQHVHARRTFVDTDASRRCLSPADLAAGLEEHVKSCVPAAGAMSPSVQAMYG